MFPRLTDPFFRDALVGSYADTTNTVVIDPQPRIISNLIVDQTSNNPAAVAVAGAIGADLIWGTADDVLNDGVTITEVRAGADGILGDDITTTETNEGADDIAEFSFDNVTPDEGLSAPFNLWFVFFGQFFDHGLDLVHEGRQRHGLHPAAAGRSRSTSTGRYDQLHAADAGDQRPRARRHPG